MPRAFGWPLTLGLMILGGPVAAEAPEAAAIPLSLAVTATPFEVATSGAVTVVVRLKNFNGDVVATSEPLVVAVTSELSDRVSVPMSAGQSTARVELRFRRAGVATLVASAPHLSSGSAAVVVKGDNVPAAGDSQGVAPQSATGGSLPSPATNAGFATSAAGSTMKAAAHRPGETAPTLAIDLMPQHVHPTGAAWRASALVTAMNGASQPIAVPEDTALYLATDIGVVTPAFTCIRAGKARVGESIQLTSDRPGTGTLWAWTDTGSLASATIEYHQPVPTQLLVRGLPARAVNDGRTAIKVTVFLQDETATTASADADLLVQLTSSLGTPSPSTISIPKGKFFGEAALFSPTSGIGEITATALGLKSGAARVEFVFPTLLVILAAAGGLIGSLFRSGQRVFTGKWWRHLLGSVGVGIVLGIFVYSLALFGIVASIPLAVPFERLPTTNELGALVLGFLGGYYVRAWLPEPQREPALPSRGSGARALLAREELRARQSVGNSPGSSRRVQRP